MSDVSFRNMQELQTYIRNMASYKPARKKQCIVWCCMPVVGTEVHNTIDNLNYKTNDRQRFIISGIRGELSVIDVDTLARDYTFCDGDLITSNALKSKLENGVIDWFQVKTIVDTNTSFRAVFIPERYPFQVQHVSNGVLGAMTVGNRAGIPHGKGDFVVYETISGKPNLYSLRIVNGVIFGDTFDNRGWTDCLDTAFILKSAPVKPTLCVSGQSGMKKQQVSTTVNVGAQNGKPVSDKAHVPVQTVAQNIEDFKRICKVLEISKIDGSDIDSILSDASVRETAADMMAKLREKYACDIQALERVAYLWKCSGDELWKYLTNYINECTGCSNSLTVKLMNPVRCHYDIKERRFGYAVEPEFRDPDINTFYMYSGLYLNKNGEIRSYTVVSYDCIRDCYKLSHKQEFRRNINFNFETILKIVLSGDSEEQQQKSLTAALRQGVIELLNGFFKANGVTCSDALDIFEYVCEPLLENLDKASLYKSSSVDVSTMLVCRLSFLLCFLGLRDTNNATDYLMFVFKSFAKAREKMLECVGDNLGKSNPDCNYSYRLFYTGYIGEDGLELWSEVTLSSGLFNRIFYLVDVLFSYPHREAYAILMEDASVEEFKLSGEAEIRQGYRGHVFKSRYGEYGFGDIVSANYNAQEQAANDNISADVISYVTSDSLLKRDTWGRQGFGVHLLTKVLDDVIDYYKRKSFRLSATGEYAETFLDYFSGIFDYMRKNYNVTTIDAIPMSDECIKPACDYLTSLSNGVPKRVKRYMYWLIEVRTKLFFRQLDNWEARGFTFQPFVTGNFSDANNVDCTSFCTKILYQGMNDIAPVEAYHIIDVFRGNGVRTYFKRINIDGSFKEEAWGLGEGFYFDTIVKEIKRLGGEREFDTFPVDDYLGNLSNALDYGRSFTELAICRKLNEYLEYRGLK